MKLIGFTLGVVLVMLVSGFSLSKGFTVVDNYNEVIINQPYQVEVCKEVTTEAGDEVSGAIWGAIFGAIVGDAIDDENGRLPGAIIGAGIGANEEKKKGETTTTSTVCETETRYNQITSTEYSHSTIKFTYKSKQYEIDFIK